MTKPIMDFDAAEFIASTGDSDVESIVDAAYEEGFEKAREYFAYLFDISTAAESIKSWASDFVRKVP